MNRQFTDIIKKMGIPFWYDALGYPRYCEFKPNATSNIYAIIVGFIKISCQACEEKFMVAQTFSVFDIWQTKKFTEYKKEVKIKNDEPLIEHVLPFFKSLSAEDLGNFIHYGDPPNHNCVGDTMNCNDLEIIEFWIMERFDWKRISALEIKLPQIDE